MSDELRKRWFESLGSDKELRGDALRVALIILSFIDEGWEAKTTMAQIGRTLGLSRQNTNRAVKQLCDAGYVEKCYRNGNVVGFLISTDFDVEQPRIAI